MTSLSSTLRVDSLLNFSTSKRLPLILQTEAAECGLACLAMIANYFGHDYDLASLRRQSSVSAQGMTLKHLIDKASNLELTSRALKLDVEDIVNLQTPCILHWEMKHFVVLKKITRHGVVILDPAVGERRIDKQTLSDCFTGIALELTPSPSFTPTRARQQLNLSHFWSRISGLKRSLGVILLLSLLLQLFAIASPYYMQTIIDDVILRSDENLLTVLALGFGILLFVETGTHLLRQLSILKLSSRLNMQMSANVFHHLIRLPLEYFSKRHMGDVVSRFSSMSQVRELLTTGLVSVIIDGLMALITLVVMFFYSKQLAFIAIAVVLVYAALRYTFYRPYRRLNEESIAAAAKENSIFMESVRAVQTIKLFEKESDRQNQWQNALADVMNKNIRISHWGFMFDTSNKMLFGIENLVIIFIAATLVMDNLMTVGMLYAFISYKSRFISSMDNLISKWIEFRMLEVHFDRLADIVFTPQDEHFQQAYDMAGALPDTTPHTAPHLSVNNLAYRYSETDPTLFTGLQLQITQGETVAITGVSGTGKSTLLKCLMGLYPPHRGEVQLDGVNIRHIGDYRQRIAAVMQDDQLLSGSMLENIACFDPNLDSHRAMIAAQRACIHQDIMAMSMQYNTLVGDMGASLSGGQKQRILLARAFYKQPEILFMDEATSHLDQDNEQAIIQQIKALNITRVVVAHRPATVKSADRILQLANGKLLDITQTFKPLN